MNQQNNGNALNADLPTSVAVIRDPHDRVPDPDETSAAAEGQTWTTRADASETTTSINKKPIVLLGSGLAAAVLLFAITTFVGKVPQRKAPSPQPGAAPTSTQERPKGSITPLMDTVRAPASNNTAGQLTPADISRTKANTGTQMASAGPTASSRPASAPGTTLASVPPFESTQQHWEEPRPYGETQTAPSSSSSSQQQQNLLKEASLVFVKKNESAGKNFLAISDIDNENNVPSLNLTPGTRIQARLETQASSAVTAPVVAVVEYTYSLGDRIVIPAGARVYGQLQQADRSGAVSIKFDEIELLDGNREKIEAIGTSLELGPIEGTVSGKNTGKNFLVRTASGIGSVAAMLVGNNSSGAFSEDDMIRQRVAQNVGNAGDTQIMNMAVTNHIVVSVPADTPIYIVFTKREAVTASSRLSSNASQ
jgi:type IV secretory pathway VirB10-like protein